MCTMQFISSVSSSSGGFFYRSFITCQIGPQILLRNSKTDVRWVIDEQTYSMGCRNEGDNGSFISVNGANFALHHQELIDIQQVS